MDPNFPKQVQRSTDPIDLYVQLQKKKQQQQNGSGGNNNGNTSTQNNNVSFSQPSSFSGMNVLGSMSHVGSFANMGSFSETSNGNMSMVLPQGASTGPINGMNNQSWGNMNMNSMGLMDQAMHSSLPIRNASFNPIIGTDNNNSIQNNRRSLSAEMGMSLADSRRPNNHFARMADCVGSSFHDSGNTGNSFCNNAHFPLSEGIGSSGGFGGGNHHHNSQNHNATNHQGGLVGSSDFSKLTTEQLREIILRDLAGTGGERRVPSPRRASTGTTQAAGSAIHTELLQGSSNPFLKNLGTMNYRNHVLPLSLQQHSSKTKRRRRRTDSQSSNASDDQLPQHPVAEDTQSNPQASTGFFSYATEPTGSSSSFNPSFSFGGAAQHAMLDEEESYIAAEHGILAPWSARAAGLFGDMMEQSNEDEKTRKAARKKPKDKPKRPLSAYNIFFREERGRILESRAAARGGSRGEGDQDDAASLADSDGSGQSGGSNNNDINNINKLAVHRKIGFESLAKLIGRRWQQLDADSMAVYKSKASVDMERYQREMDVWNAKHGITRKRSPKSGTGASSSNKVRRRSSCNAKILTGPSSSSSSSSSLKPIPSFAETQRRNSTGGVLDLSAVLKAQEMLGRTSPKSSFPQLKETRLHSDLFQLSSEEI
mmetsp:Transcript_27620/g.64814  ORF Transcript_27620/g.64814 Transcript_27620/m.64814 type:complete len:653 (+) Transcript_27620:281-2239(+)|eukprot:CAMPEP_0172401910 /NCGR_PEP_ID=MMETSP1061-20121228/52491_1 /TAXON_ID=37318 /ORGANISM="Pseudo-nitzschia pungens, Strain cf. pungens" /LENGTH=652 /DNA_ID=CAMNT_0013135723 /DNA_START=265 /DNA_END=2223 /DNA_ORIENTATION=-